MRRWRKRREPTVEPVADPVEELAEPAPVETEPPAPAPTQSLGAVLLELHRKEPEQLRRRLSRLERRDDRGRYENV